MRGKERSEQRSVGLGGIKLRSGLAIRHGQGGNQHDAGEQEAGNHPDAGEAPNSVIRDVGSLKIHGELGFRCVHIQ